MYEPSEYQDEAFEKLEQVHNGIEELGIVQLDDDSRFWANPPEMETDDRGLLWLGTHVDDVMDDLMDDYWNESDHAAYYVHVIYNAEKEEFNVVNVTQILDEEWCQFGERVETVEQAAAVASSLLAVGTDIVRSWYGQEVMDD